MAPQLLYIIYHYLALHRQDAKKEAPMKKCRLMLAAVATMSLMMASCSNDDPKPVNPVTPTDETFEALKQSSINEFLDFAKNPRLGFHLDKAKAYLKSWAEKHGYQYNSDAFDNVWIDVPANNSAMANYPKVILQGHTDMICASKAGESYDYTTEVGEPYYDGDLLKGRKINLGSDDGIGVGIALAIASSDVAHGPLRLLFTANEDYDMSGAINLDPSVLDANYMINIDEEEAGKISVGCLGSYSLEFARNYTTSSTSSDTKVLAVNITGLRGGHSGVMIGEHRLSATTVTADVVKNVITPAGGNIVTINCGHAVNAIAIESFVEFAVPSSKIDECKEAIDKIMAVYISEYPDETEFDFDVAERSLTSEDVLCSAQLNTDLNAFFATATQGVIEKEGDLPSKSNNIGEIILSDGSLWIEDMFRSYSAQWIESERDRLIAEGEKIGFNVQVTGYVPTWDTPGVSPLKDLIYKYYKDANPNAFTDKAKGGLECAYFVLKNPQLYAVSVGPQLDGAHTIDEAVHVSTITPLLKAIVNTLQHINEIGQ